MSSSSFWTTYNYRSKNYNKSDVLGRCLKLRHATKQAYKIPTDHQVALAETLAFVNRTLKWNGGVTDGGTCTLLSSLLNVEKICRCLLSMKMKMRIKMGSVW